MNLYERTVRGAHRAYKLTLSPLIGRQCRFMPTCSDYAAEVLVTHGPWRGGALAVRRLCRCHPWGGSGWDPPPPREDPDRKDGGRLSRTWICEGP
jgi:hypothetical protein